ncbi:hypothetical protein NX801_08165 [Streptomyces sp. LP05-1]|uniref:DUF8017 domain-containing protein n=1 Tax=Streptomyces pyxinae TaxID=2970734 RepID=A0ABT2CE09_9ACTN|nr:hypothetical protein [Streptomyces sp. LP05-1]MCS0635637.1 hypothetical protein [Streptomyces sp. LP05-1]
MWPGQQPPGGEQDPQDPRAQGNQQQHQNPYRQPGYQQPNPYQQPGPPQPPTQPGHLPPGPPPAGHGAPNPYQQPTVGAYAVPGQQPGAPVPPDGGNRKKTTVTAIVAALAVLAAAGVTGFLVLGNKDDTGDKDPSQVTAGRSAGSSAAAPGPAGSAPAADTASSPPAANPRSGAGAAKPTVPGWKVVFNPKYGTLFDVPPTWEVRSPGSYIGFDDLKAGDGRPVVTMSSPAEYKSAWCSEDADHDGSQEKTGLATAGSKGAQGARNTAEVATVAAANWVWAAYAQQEPKGVVKVSKAQPFTARSGLTGHVATATAVGTKKSGRCDSDGKSIAFGFKNSAGDFVSWILYGAKGVPDELPEATVQQILGTVRLAPAGS